MTRRTNSAIRNDPEGPTLTEAARIAADRERASRWIAIVAILFLCASFAPHAWRAIQ